MTNAIPVGLYLHIPFCQSRCSYCDFNTYAGMNPLIPRYVESLCREIEAWAGRDLAARTVFFGGGTPSLLSAEQIDRVLTTIRAAFELDPAAEITLEANPGAVDVVCFQGARAAGVNRISLGVQSFFDDDLRSLTRLHTAEDVERAVDGARRAGFDSLNLDLIYSLPGQTIERWQGNLQRAIALHPEHLSLYALTVEPGTPLNAAVARGQLQPPDPDLAADMYELAAELTAAAGYEQYEISNWAKPGHACRHNLVYWRNEPYLGFGAGAHSCYAGRRFSNLRSPNRYVKALWNTSAGPFWHPLPTALDQCEELSAQRALEDTLFMGLRLSEGIDLAVVADRQGVDIAARYGATLGELQSWGLLEWTDDRLRLTARGRLLSNEVFVRFLEL